MTDRCQKLGLKIQSYILLQSPKVTCACFSSWCKSRTLILKSNVSFYCSSYNSNPNSNTDVEMKVFLVTSVTRVIWPQRKEVIHTCNFLQVFISLVYQGKFSLNQILVWVLPYHAENPDCIYFDENLTATGLSIQMNY